MVPPEATIHHGLAQRVRMFGEDRPVPATAPLPHPILAQAVYAVSPYKLDSKLSNGRSLLPLHTP